MKRIIDDFTTYMESVAALHQMFPLCGLTSDRKISMAVRRNREK